jgi:hypothetical protein
MKIGSHFRTVIKSCFLTIFWQFYDKAASVCVLFHVERCENNNMSDTDKQVGEQEDFVTVGELWAAIQEKMETAQPDLMKCARGVRSAGARARKQLRAVRTDITKLVKLTTVIGKAAQSERKAAASAE